MKYAAQIIIFCLFLQALAVRLPAQNNAAAETVLTAQLKANTHPLFFKEGKISGEGADFLIRAANDAEFFLIGEEHGFAENPLFAAAILQELKGYKFFASEIGKMTAPQLEEAARRMPVRKVLTEFNRKYPFSLPFFNWQEEGTLLETALKIPRGKMPVFWGLDQEFFFSPIYHFERLRELAPNAKARAVVQEYYDKTQTELQRSIETHNPGASFIITATAADFDKLNAAFNNKNPEAQQILNSLRESAEIYQKNSKGEIYANNLQRSMMLKRNFMSYYNAALKTEKQPKVFFKFGAAHITRGRNYVNVFDLGNLVSELAASQGTSSFHVLVMAAGGTYNKFIPFAGNEADKKKTLVPANVYFYTDVKPFLSLSDSQGWKVIDLRPLRPLLGTKKLPDPPRGFADIITGFDALVLVSEAHPATLFGQ